MSHYTCPLKALEMTKLEVMLFNLLCCNENHLDDLTTLHVHYKRFLNSFIYLNQMQMLICACIYLLVV